MATQTRTQDAVVEAIRSDPRIPHPEEIAVLVDEDAVILRGTVGTFSQRCAAVRAASRVQDAHYVDDRLTIHLLDAAQRSDAELRGMALQRIAWDIQAPAELIAVTVTDGWVTLTGTVPWQFESDAAFEDVAKLFGVIGVTNEIRVLNP